jgi:hypothetical protein
MYQAQTRNISVCECAEFSHMEAVVHSTVPGGFCGVAVHHRERAVLPIRSAHHYHVPGESKTDTSDLLCGAT